MERKRVFWMAPLAIALVAIGCGVRPEADGTNDRPAGWPEEFVVGFFGQDDAEAVLEEQEALRAFMEEQLGIPVRTITGTSYTAVIEAMRSKRVDAMEVGPFSYCLAVQEAHAEALAVGVIAREEDPVYDPGFPPYYYSVFITRKGSGIRNLQDLKGRSFAFVDPASTSGHLAPKTALIKAGIDPDEDMETIFAGSHPTSALSVANGKVDAGATYEVNLFRLIDEGQIDWCAWPDGMHSKKRTAEEMAAVYEDCPEGHLVVIGFSDPIPTTPFAIRSDLPDDFKRAVKNVLLEVKNHPVIVAEIRRWFTDPSEEFGLETLDAYYNPLREMAVLLDLDLKELGG